MRATLAPLTVTLALVNRTLLMLAFALSALLVSQSFALDPAAYRGKVFLGMGGDVIELAESVNYESTHGMALKRIPVLSTGDLAGLKIGDILVSIEGRP